MGGSLAFRRGTCHFEAGVRGEGANGRNFPANLVKFSFAKCRRRAPPRTPVTIGTATLPAITAPFFRNPRDIDRARSRAPLIPDRAADLEKNRQREARDHCRS